jgi:hypothetical protein
MWSDEEMGSANNIGGCKEGARQTTNTEESLTTRWNTVYFELRIHFHSGRVAFDGLHFYLAAQRAAWRANAAPLWHGDDRRLDWRLDWRFDDEVQFSNRGNGCALLRAPRRLDVM